MKCRASLLLIAAGLLLAVPAPALAAFSDSSTSIAQSEPSTKAAQEEFAQEQKLLDHDGEKLPELSKTVEINAPVQKVWEAIQARRSSDPSKRKLMSYDGKVAVIKEFFLSVPIIGNTICTYVERELIPHKAIEYKMLSSNRFHTFEGYWQLAEGSKPGTTSCTLTTILDPGVRIPFWQQIAKNAMQKDLDHNLECVTELATKK